MFPFADEADLPPQPDISPAVSAPAVVDVPRETIVTPDVSRDLIHAAIVLTDWVPDVGATVYTDNGKSL
jgi:hypothetical protein